MFENIQIILLIVDLFSVPLDLSVHVKATLIGATFLIVSNLLQLLSNIFNFRTSFTSRVSNFFLFF